jgi:hypothetical protein
MVPPVWFVAFALLCGLVVAFMLPAQIARPVRRALIDSDAAKLVAALSAVVAFVVVLFTAYQIKLDIDDRETERAIRREEAIERAWDRLLRQTPGNTSKGEALSYLVAEGRAPSGIDLSCRALGQWDGHCTKRVTFSSIRMKTPPGAEQVTLVETDMSDAELFQVTLENVHWSGDFSRARFSEVVAVDSTIIGKFDGATFDYADFTGSILDVENREALPHLGHVNLSGAMLPWAVETELRSDAMFWADAPPVRLFPGPYFTLLDRGDDGTDNRLPNTVLQGATICKPPLGDDGRPIPWRERQPLSAARGYRLPGGQACDAVTIFEAIELFPDSYRSWEEAAPPVEPPAFPLPELPGLPPAAGPEDPSEPPEDCDPATESVLFCPQN